MQYAQNSITQGQSVKNDRLPFAYKNKFNKKSPSGAGTLESDTITQGAMILNLASNIVSYPCKFFNIIYKGFLHPFLDKKGAK